MNNKSQFFTNWLLFLKQHITMQKTKYNHFTIDSLYLILLIMSFNLAHSYLYSNVNIIYDTPSTLAFLWKATPVLSLYCLLRIVRLNSLTSFLLTNIVLFIIRQINLKKLATLDIPISFSDFVEYKNFSIAYHYISTKEIFIFSALFIITILCYRLGRKLHLRLGKQNYKHNSYLFTLFIFL